MLRTARSRKRLPRRSNKSRKAWSIRQLIACHNAAMECYRRAANSFSQLSLNAAFARSPMCGWVASTLMADDMATLYEPINVYKAVAQNIGIVDAGRDLNMRPLAAPSCRHPPFV